MTETEALRETIERIMNDFERCHEELLQARARHQVELQEAAEMIRSMETQLVEIRQRQRELQAQLPPTRVEMESWVPVANRKKS